MDPTTFSCLNECLPTWYADNQTRSCEQICSSNLFADNSYALKNVLKTQITMGTIESAIFPALIQSHPFLPKTKPEHATPPALMVAMQIASICVVFKSAPKFNMASWVLLLSALTNALHLFTEIIRPSNVWKSVRTELSEIMAPGSAWKDVLLKHTPTKI